MNNLRNIFKNSSSDYFPLLIVTLASLSFVRSMLIHDVIWDDNCWLRSYYATSNLHEFLSTGFYELRRVPLGTFMYFYYSLHKITDHVYFVWNSINLTVQILSPVFLYGFINNLFKKKRLLAFLIASTFIVCLIDNTLPYYISISYRMGTLFSIISFYLTERALVKETRWKLLFTALLISAFSSYFLMETTIALEPARLFLIGYILSGKHSDRKSLVKRCLTLWLPFILAIIPLVVYKLVYKTYGFYESTYALDPLFFLKFKLHARVLKHFMFKNWVYLSGLISNTSAWSVGLGLLSVVLVFYILKRFTVSTADKPTAIQNPKDFTFRSIFLKKYREVRHLFVLGLALVVPAVMVYELTGKIPTPAMPGRHATILLFGYAVAFGGLIYCLYTALLSRYLKHIIPTLLIVFFIGGGVFFNNLNLDVYFAGTEYQQRFWKTFTARFSVLPEKASFFMDVRDKGPFYEYVDLLAYYELELPLNILYARSKDPKEFRNYRVYPVSLGIKEEWKKSDTITFQRISHLGKDTYNSQEFIMIYYRGGEILVNREILKKYPDVLYRMWLDKDPPKFSGTIPEYPLRYKFKGFY